MSTLVDVYETVVARFAAAGSDTIVLFGERFLEREGNANQIVLVPQGGPVLAGPIRITTNGVAQADEDCIAYIWGADDESDPTSGYAAANAIMQSFVVILQEYASGRVTWKNADLNLAHHVVTYGSLYQLRFSFAYQINKTALAALPGSPILYPTAEVVELT